jgi:hypothetical protein
MADHAMSDRTYRIVVTREDDNWLADVPDLQGAHTFARNLETLDRYVREVIVLAADLPDDAMDSLALDWDIHTGDLGLDDELGVLRHQRQDLEAQRSHVEEMTTKYAQQLDRHGFSVRDTGVLLGVSRARAHQLVSH